MALIIVLCAVAGYLCVKFNLSEALLGWTRPHERLQLDELPGILLIIAVCLIWFSARRYVEVIRQLEWRRATEAKLAAALAENQRLAQQYLDMQEVERKALARDLHDELGQTLNVIKLDAVAIRDAQLPAGASAPQLAGAMIENIDRIDAVVANLIRQLRPVGFDDLGVAAALEHCVQDWRRRLAGTRIELMIECDLDDLDETRGLALFRLVQEALTNMARHAHATRATIRITREQVAGPRGERLVVRVTDDGRGVDLAERRSGLGLIGMRERATACGGTFEISSAPGAGFTVTASLLLDARLKS
jgi:signal transduction histidine kinase